VRTIGQELAQRVAALVERWRLQVEERFPETPGSPGNFVAAARRADGTRCVLKVSPHLRETRSEIAALASWQGDGAARLVSQSSFSSARTHCAPSSWLRSIARCCCTATCTTSISCDLTAQAGWRSIRKAWLEIGTSISASFCSIRELYRRESTDGDSTCSAPSWTSIQSAPVSGAWLHAVLNASWSFEEGDKYASWVAYAEQTLSF